MAFGLSKDKDGSAALSGYVMWLVVTTLLSMESLAQLQGISADDVNMAFDNVDNQFVGIIVGIISAEIYNRFSHVELPKFLAFFSGKRLVPILTSIAGMILSFILMTVWYIVFLGYFLLVLHCKISVL